MTKKQKTWLVAFLIVFVVIIVSISIIVDNANNKARQRTSTMLDALTQGNYEAYEHRTIREIAKSYIRSYMKDQKCLQVINIVEDKVEINMIDIAKYSCSLDVIGSSGVGMRTRCVVTLHKTGNAWQVQNLY